MKQQEYIEEELECGNCNNLFVRRQTYYSEYRKRKLGHVRFFCSKQCQVESVKKRCLNRTDQYTGFRQLLKSSTSRNKEHSLSLEDMKQVWDKQEGKCIYTGVSLIRPTNRKRKVPAYYAASLDRKDNSKGYTKDNIQFVSITANYAKNRGTHEEMLEFIKIIQQMVSVA